MKSISITLENSLREAAILAGVRRLIVGAVIPNTNSVLVLKRAPDDFMPGILELPSGQVEAQETLSEALRREVLEETGLEVIAITDFLGSFDYLSKSGQLSRQFNFVTNVVQGALTLTEHTGYAWLTENELQDAWITESTRNTIHVFMRGDVG